MGKLVLLEFDGGPRVYAPDGVPLSRLKLEFLSERVEVPKRVVVLKPERVKAIFEGRGKVYVVYETDHLDFYAPYLASGLPEDAKPVREVKVTLLTCAGKTTALWDGDEPYCLVKDEEGYVRADYESLENVSVTVWKWDGRSEFQGLVTRGEDESVSYPYIGEHNYRVVAQIVAEELGIDLSKATIDFHYRKNLPFSLSGGRAADLGKRVVGRYEVEASYEYVLDHETGELVRAGFQYVVWDPVTKRAVSIFAPSPPTREVLEAAVREGRKEFLYYVVRYGLADKGVLLDVVTSNLEKAARVFTLKELASIGVDREVLERVAEQLVEEYHENVVKEKEMVYVEKLVSVVEQAKELGLKLRLPTPPPEVSQWLVSELSKERPEWLARRIHLYAEYLGMRPGELARAIKEAAMDEARRAVEKAKGMVPDWADGVLLVEVRGSLYAVPVKRSRYGRGFYYGRGWRKYKVADAVPRGLNTPLLVMRSGEVYRVRMSEGRKYSRVEAESG